MGIQTKDFWYIACESRELKTKKPLARKILNEWLVLFRDQNGQAVCFQDRCIHRQAQLSLGRVQKGEIQCPYHGWTYQASGQVSHIPAEGPGAAKSTKRCAKTYEVIEQDDYVYIRLNSEALELKPFKMPHYQEKNYTTIRLINRFQNNVTNCAENFVDIPHTIFVHPKIFRDTKYQAFRAKVIRENGEVHVDYQKETSNFGIFSWFLNSSGKEILHTDSFYMPNITSVHYRFGERRHFIITSQSVPVSDCETLVYTDLTYDYGIWNRLARPVIRWQGQTIIDQDVAILGNQMKVIEKYGSQFTNTQADIIHVFIESIQKEIAEGRDPRLLPHREQEIEFWV